MAAPKLRFKEFDGDWSQSKIGEIFQVTSGSTPLRSDNRFFENADIAWVKTTDLNNGLIEKTEEKISQIALKETSVKILPKGTVFVAMYGGFNQIGRTGLLVHEAACNQALSAIYPNEKIDSYFLLTFLNHKVDDWKNFAASSRKDPNITKSDVLAFPLKYPVKEEQTKIASFLSAVDEKISQLTQKHQLVSQYKQGMMQKLFSQQIRFKADDGSEFGEWEETLLSEFLTESLIKGLKGNEAKKLTVKLWGKGVVSKNEAFEGSENTQYYKRFVGQLIYGKLDFLNCAFGIIPAHLDGYETTIDAPSFDINKEKANPYFLLNRFLQKDFYKKNGEEADGSRKAKRINQSVFLAMQIDLPCLEEQTKIANFLSAIDQKIEVVAQQIEQAKTWKKGLLQQMFV
ncbi:restriction endonuclease subunit S [Acinetobacter johnsonii]|uniref:Restriction endonuclease subunit S n=2 Tax=Acinetobacter johnsonii TaxID=40214 RepID=A0AA43BLY3_ACIJO|nr:restriction endonuclease subunit S [Acinetobacter johnsonii]MDH2171819.1 restriction endonuclease subunit S [Acinetobacter johnsonii]MDH2175174.1 restriction endonuclease subunit S [Acinetobacter johnsonii]